MQTENVNCRFFFFSLLEAQLGKRFIRETLGALGIDAAMGRTAGASGLGLILGGESRTTRIKASAPSLSILGAVNLPCGVCCFLFITLTAGLETSKLHIHLKGQIFGSGPRARVLHCFSGTCRGFLVPDCSRRPGDPPHPVFGSV